MNDPIENKFLLTILGYIYTLPSYAMKVHFLCSNLVNLSYSYDLAISVFINNKMFNLVILRRFLCEKIKPLTIQKFKPIIKIFNKDKVPF